MFNLAGKVALVTGGAAGIGLSIVKQLLKQNVKGVAVIDINKEVGTKVVKELQNECGNENILFMEADVSDKNQFTEAFKTTIESFKNLDIVVNNAGIAEESKWEKTIAVNLTGTVTGTILGFEEFLPKYKSGNEAVIVNIASLAGINIHPYIPIYSATKHGIIGLTRCFGSELHYNRKKVKVIAMCPDYTDTSLNDVRIDSFLNLDHQHMYEDLKPSTFQSVTSVAKATLLKIQEAKTGSVWVIQDEHMVYEINPSTALKN